MPQSNSSAIREQCDTVTTAGRELISARMQPIHWWALLGAAFVLLQFYVFGAWFLSDEFRPTNPGMDSVPATSRFAFTAFQVVMVTLTPFMIWRFVYRYRRDGRLGIYSLVQIGWLLTFWQDPLLNYLQPVFVYNAHMLNFGSWCNFIPGWVSPHGSRMPEPFLVVLPAYFFLLPANVLAGTWAIRKVAKRWPYLDHVSLYFVGVLGTMLSMVPLDMFSARVMHVDSWPGAHHALTLWAGNFFQFPLYESLFFSMNLGASAIMIHMIDQRGFSFVERGAESMHSGAKRTTLRILAVAAHCNLANLFYAIVMAVVGVSADPWPTNMPTWLQVEQCAGATGLQCPGPGVPIYRHQ